jgi:hypothetical protein
VTATQTEAKQSLAFFSGAKFSSATPKFSRVKNNNGVDVLRVEGMAIFRSGSFRDSMGYDHTYDPFHIDQMVSNFGFLASKGILDNLPVRAGHPSPFTNYMNEMVGHIRGLRTQELVNPTDGDKYTYLLADFEIFDADAAEKIEKGLWVNRSSEVGMYATNNGSEFYPTLVGFAYVDIPAVEGLNFSKNAGFNKSFVVARDDEMKEVPIVGADNEGGNGGNTPAPFQFSLRGGQTITDFAAVQAHITAIESENDSLKSENDELKKFETEQKQAGRKALVDKLMEEKKVLASQEADLTAYVNSLSDDQFSAYSAIMAQAPVLSLLGTHSAAPEAGGTPAADQTGTTTDPAVEQAQRVYQRHITSGMSPDKAAQTSSGKLLKEKGLI